MSPLRFILVTLAIVSTACWSERSTIDEETMVVVPDSLVSTSVVASLDSAGIPLDSLVFKEVGRFGPASSNVPLGEAALKSPPLASEVALLERPRMAVNGPNGRLYVLDPPARRIIVYGRDGAPLGAMGAFGEGPGEMARPLGIDVDELGRVAVVDIQLRRVTVYDPSGNTLSSGSIAKNGAAIVLHDTVADVLTDFSSSSQGTTLRVQLSGSLLSELVVPTARDKEFARGGVIGWLSRGFDPGQSIYFSGAPGRFVLIDREGRASRPIGTELFPEAGFKQLDEGGKVPLSYTTAATMSGGPLSDRQAVFVAYYSNLSVIDKVPATPVMDWGIAILSASGEFVGKGVVPAEWGPAMGVTPGPNNTLYFVSLEPEPHIKQITWERVARAQDRD